MKLVLSKSFETQVEPTKHVLEMAAMFGIGVDETKRMVLYDELCIDLEPGKVVYITGESGAGKSCLLRDIRTAATSTNAPGFKEVEYTLTADELENPQPLVDMFGDSDLKTSAGFMAFAGISEPFVMMRRFNELSDGQRYRFQLARMMWQATRTERPIVFVDEFLAFLDRETAKVVAHQVRKTAWRSKICFVVATTHDDIAHDLNPDVQVTMRLNNPPRIEASKVLSDS